MISVLRPGMACQTMAISAVEKGRHMLSIDRGELNEVSAATCAGESASTRSVLRAAIWALVALGIAVEFKAAICAVEKVAMISVVRPVMALAGDRCHVVGGEGRDLLGVERGELNRTHGFHLRRRQRLGLVRGQGGQLVGSERRDLGSGHAAIWAVESESMLSPVKPWL